MYYQIKETLTECSFEELKSYAYPYVAVISMREFEENRQAYDIGIDLEIDAGKPHVTKIQVNYDSLTGSVAIPDKYGETDTFHTFSFAIDEKGIVIINDDGVAEKIIQKIIRSKKWKFPGLERFLYDFLESIVDGDLMLLEGLEKEMDKMEDRVLQGDSENILRRLAAIRSKLLDLQIHYEQLLDFGAELEENENNFFDAENLRYFGLFIDRVERLKYVVSSLRDHTIQVGDMYYSILAEKQNNNMSYLTVIATIFLPLTLMTGWYGMNFQYMPELDKPWAYYAFIGVCIGIVLLSIWIFKRKKWF